MVIFFSLICFFRQVIKIQLIFYILYLTRSCSCRCNRSCSCSCSCRCSCSYSCSCRCSCSYSCSWRCVAVLQTNGSLLVFLYYKNIETFIMKKKLYTYLKGSRTNAGVPNVRVDKKNMNVQISPLQKLGS